MTDAATNSTSEKSPGKAIWISAIGVLLTALIGVATLAYTAWDQSIESAKEQGRLEAELKMKDALIAQYKEDLITTQKQLRETQTALQDSKYKLSDATSGLHQASGQNSDLARSVKELQEQNADLKEALREADLCRPIQQRIAEIETKLEQTGGFGGYSAHQLDDARRQLAEHQASLRTCLSTAR